MMFSVAQVWPGPIDRVSVTGLPEGDIAAGTVVNLFIQAFDG
jgi:hypothetical protein